MDLEALSVWLCCLLTVRHVAKVSRLTVEQPDAGEWSLLFQSEGTGLGWNTGCTFDFSKSVPQKVKE